MTQETRRQSEKRIVVTGVSRGLGLALAEGLIHQGHTVIGCARSSRVVDQLRDQWPAPHRFDCVDVADAGQVDRWASQTLAWSKNCPPDFLINNAATINKNAPLWEVPPDEFSRVIDVNIKGVVNVIRAFVPAMIERQHGVIVNLSSGWGRAVSAEVAPYCATKWAIEGLTRALALELPEGMAAIPLDPGIINTEMLQSCFGDAASSYPDPQSWAKSAVPFILAIGPDENGQPLMVPID